MNDATSTLQLGSFTVRFEPMTNKGVLCVWTPHVPAADDLTEEQWYQFRLTRSRLPFPALDVHRAAVTTD